MVKYFFLFFVFLFVTSIHVFASIRKTPIQMSLSADIASRKGTSFEPIVERWQDQFGTRAVQPLIQIAQENSRPDADRYVALMGAAKLGGPGVAQKVLPFLKDPSWMIRSAALRIFSAYHDRQYGPDLLPLLQDPALVVRFEAISAIQELRPIGCEDALVKALKDQRNYHGGKALWVPGRALSAIAELRARDVAPQLLPLLDHHSDPALQKKTLETLDILSGRKTTDTASLDTRILHWKNTFKKSN